MSGSPVPNNPDPKQNPASAEVKPAAPDLGLFGPGARDVKDGSKAAEDKSGGKQDAAQQPVPQPQSPGAAPATPAPAPRITPPVLTAEETVRVAVIEKCMPSIAYISSFSGLGSGVAIQFGKAKGLILTNVHVIDGAQNSLKVRLYPPKFGPKEYDAKELGRIPELDLAIIQIKDPPAGFLPLPLGDSKSMKPGRSVIALGHPFGQEWTATHGIVSALRDARHPDGQIIRGVIQTDAMINPGNSGGALVNYAGEIVAVNTFGVTRSGGSHGVDYAVPITGTTIDSIKRVLPQVVSFGWQLADGNDIDDNLPPVVYRVFKGGPAEQEGIVGAERFETSEVKRSLWQMITGQRQEPVVTRVVDPLNAYCIESVNGHETRSVEEINQMLTETAQQKLADGQIPTLDFTFRVGGSNGQVIKKVIRPKLVL